MEIIFKNGSKLKTFPQSGGEALKGSNMEESKVHEQSEVTVFSAAKVALGQLKEEYGNRVYDVTTYQGLVEAKQARAEVRKWRTTVEKVRKAEKAKYLEAGRMLDAGARELTAELRTIENPIDELIKAEEFKKAEEKRIKEEAEQKRIDGIMAVLTEISGIPRSMNFESADDVAFAINTINNRVDVETNFFAEFTEQAKATVKKAKEELQVILEKAKEREAEAERVAREQEEILAKEAAMAEERAKMEAEKEAAEELKRQNEEMIRKAQADIDKEREELEKQKSEAAAAKEISEASVKEAVDEMVEDYKPEGKALKGITHVAKSKMNPEEVPDATNSHVYPSQGEALVAIYELCTSTFVDPQVKVLTEIEMIAQANMGEK